MGRAGERLEGRGVLRPGWVWGAIRRGFEADGLGVVELEGRGDQRGAVDGY